MTKHKYYVNMWVMSEKDKNSDNSEINGTDRSESHEKASSPSEIYILKSNAPTVLRRLGGVAVAK